MGKAKLKNNISAYIEDVAEKAGVSDYRRLKKLEILLSEFIDYSFNNEEKA